MAKDKNTNTTAVLVDDFVMRFDTSTVIDHLSFNVQKGETFGFLGSNGSGKTTTIRALLGIYQPTAGTLLVNGKQFRPEMGGKLGYLPEERGLYRKEAVLDVMVYFGLLKGMDRHAALTWSQSYLERVGMSELAHARVEKLSGGQQQKVQLGVTIMNDPDLLILDEPTKGFDPVNRRLLMDIIEDHKERGATVVMVTHQMEEVERLCDRIIMLKDGKSAAYGTVDEVKDQFGTSVIEVGFTGVMPMLKDLFTIQLKQPNYAVLKPARAGTEPDIIRALAAHKGLNISSFTTSKPSLDDIFVRIYGEQTEDKNGK